MYNHVKTILVFFILLFFIQNLQASDGKVDSIRILISNETDTDIAIENYVELCRHIAVKDIDQLEVVSNELLDFAAKHMNNRGIAHAYSFLGYQKLVLGDIAASINLYSEGLNYSKQFDQDLTIKMLNNISIANERIGKIDEVLESAESALNIAVEIDDIKLLADCYQRLGAIHGKILNDPVTGLEYIDKALASFTQLGNSDGYAKTLYTKGSLLTLVDHNSAKEVFIEAEALAGQDPMLASLLPYIRNSLIQIYSNQSDYSKSIDLLEKNLRSAEKLKDYQIICSSHVFLGDIYKELANEQLALENYNKAIELSIESSNYSSHISALSGIGLLYFDSDYDKSNNYLEQSLELADSLQFDYLRMQIMPLLALGYLNSSKLSEAKQLIDKIESIPTELTFEIKKQLYLAKGQYYFLVGQLNLAEKITKKLIASQVADKDYKLKLQSAKLYSDILQEQGRYLEALDSRNKQLLLIDSFYILENQEKITTVKLTSQFEKEKALIELNNEKETVILKEKQKRTSLFGYLSLIGVVLLSTFLFVLRDKNKVIRKNNHQLEKLNELKDAIFQIIGHDLRKPSINFRNIGMKINHLIESKDYTRLQQLGSEIDQDAKSLYNLIDNILNWAIIQKDRMVINTKEVSLNNIINENIDLFESIATQKQIRIIQTVEPKSNVFADFNSVNTIIRNLLDNALKYSDTGSTLEIKVTRQDDKVSIAVIDEGVGISKEKLQELNSSNGIKTSEIGIGGEKGSGLGLGLVKFLSVINNGRFFVENNTIKGVKATLILPKA